MGVALNILYFMQIRGMIKQGCGRFTWFCGSFEYEIVVECSVLRFISDFPDVLHRFVW